MQEYIFQEPLNDRTEINIEHYFLLPTEQIFIPSYIFIFIFFFFEKIINYLCIRFMNNSVKLFTRNKIWNSIWIAKLVYKFENRDTKIIIITLLFNKKIHFSSRINIYLFVSQFERERLESLLHGNRSSRFSLNLLATKLLNYLNSHNRNFQASTLSYSML